MKKKERNKTKLRRERIRRWRWPKKTWKLEDEFCTLKGRTVRK